MRILTTALAAAAMTAAAAAAGEELTAPGPHGDLHGTYLAPANSGPIVLIIPGSGPTDRDGNSPLGVKAEMYRLLAEGLAQRGIGSVRIDKRGMFASATAADPNDVVIGDYVQDVASWVDAIEAKAGPSCVWLLGHSEGGLVALASAGKVESLCGLVLVSAAGRPLGTIMREQLVANPANTPILPDALGAIERLERGETVDASEFHPALRALFAPQVQRFLIDEFSHDPAELAAATDLPMLILQGDKDIQISLTDAEALHAARPDAGLVVLQDTNHVLKVVADDTRAANVATYATPGLPLAPGVVEAIADFIVAHAASRGDE